jgi:hypothetical protein
MPRYTWVEEGETPPTTGTSREFNVCRHCVEEPVMLNAVVARRLQVDQDQTPKVEFRKITHRPYDFSPTPVVCAACGRILGAEDD